VLPHTGILTSHKIHTWIWNRRQSWIVWYTITSSTSNYTHRNQSNVRREQFISEIAWLVVRFIYNIPNLRLLRPVCLHYPTINTMASFRDPREGSGGVQGAVMPEMLPVIWLMVYGRVKLQRKLHMTTNRTDWKRLDKHSTPSQSMWTRVLLSYDIIIISIDIVNMQA